MAFAPLAHVESIVRNLVIHIIFPSPVNKGLLNFLSLILELLAGKLRYVFGDKVLWHYSIMSDIFSQFLCSRQVGNDAPCL